VWPSIWEVATARAEAGGVVSFGCAQRRARAEARDLGRDLGVHRMIWEYYSLDWFKGKSTGNHGFYHQI
jgi:hypothetical protein